MAGDFYGTLLDALAYHAARANAAWADPGVDDTDRTAALVRASVALDGQYGDRFPGTPADGLGQALAWPRDQAEDTCRKEPIDNITIPVQIEHAAYELALIELETPGALNPSFAPGNTMKREWLDGVGGRERFGPTDGVALTLDNIRPRIAAVENLLRCLLMPDRSGGGTYWVKRA